MRRKRYLPQSITCSLALLPRRCESLVPHPSLSDLAPQSWILFCNPYQADSAAMGQLNGTRGLHIYPLNAHAVRLGAGDELVVRVRALRLQFPFPFHQCRPVPLIVQPVVAY